VEHCSFQAATGPSPARRHGNAEGWDCTTRSGLKRDAAASLLSAEESYSPLSEAILAYDCPDGTPRPM